MSFGKKIFRFFSDFKFNWKILLGVIFLWIIFVNATWLNLLWLPITDWDFFFFQKYALETTRLNYFSVWLSDLNFWRVLVDISQAPIYSLPWFFSKLGISYEISSRIIYFIPIIFFSLYWSYKFFNLLFSNETFSLVGACSIYLLNTYFLTLQTGHITLAVWYSIIPLFLYFLHKGYIESSLITIAKWWLFLLLIWYYETRLLFLVMGIIFLYFIVFISKKNFWKVIQMNVLLWLIVIWWNFFWLILLWKIWQTDNWILSRPLFWDQYWDIVHSFFIHQPWWNFIWWLEVFVESPPPILFIIYPILFIVWIFATIKSKNKQTNYITIYIILWIIWVFLWKMTAEPFRWIYPWLYENFPFFNAFREPTKFYILTALSFSVLAWYYFSKYKNTLSKLLFILLITISIFNLLIHRLNHQYLLQTKPIPDEYRVLNKIINSDPSFWRILWVPNQSRWWDYSYNHPPVKFPDFLQIKYWYWLDANTKSTFADIVDWSLMSNLEESWIKYIVLPMKDHNSKENIYIYYWWRENPEIQEYYLNGIRKIPWIKEISVWDWVKLFETNFKSSRIKSSTWDVIIQDSDHTSISFLIERNEKYEITFLEQFSSSWNIFIWNHEIKKENTKVNNYANKWIFTENEISISENDIKTINNKEYLSLKIEFSPQKYLYFWILISLLTIVFILIFITFDYFKSHNKNV